jgi:hypothetical protein
VLSAGFDPSQIPDPFAADFDEDGTIDQLSVDRTSLHVSLSGGGDFDYELEGAADSGLSIDDVKIISLNRDGRYPSIVLATRKRPGGAWYQPHIQRVILNTAGKLSAVPLSAYPLSPRGVACAGIASNELPVCFYASHADNDVRMGISKLLELDTSGRSATDSTVAEGVSGRMAQWTNWLHRLARDSAFLRYERGRWLADKVSARAMLDKFVPLDRDMLDSLLAAITTRPGADPVDTFVTASNDWVDNCSPRELGRTFWRRGVADELASVYDSVNTGEGLPATSSAVDYWLAAYASVWALNRLSVNDITTAYHLPWPHSYSPMSRTGYHMIDATFVDFSGDGLLDLVVVGQHSQIFSAVQHIDGYFVETQYHSVPGEFFRVWAPMQTDVATPPCVYYAMEPDQAFRSDFVECYDRSVKEWYEVQLPGGVYFQGRTDPVQFWDIDDDGMIDFAARKADGTWTSFTYAPENR